eukprot:gnl/TRDRNA2_/TRDRNA2_142555_c1_seq1.p1 gnl/TRDRNA2_/TRDRNA2_142555_c1~~gnl/TRDRNA2_/TRDRNA2_142555_c1_seq1.p1  ORF type:complete len:134 (-),score=13.71 gnl/TRDRNA2_/TRDRNA2_142555_c1_seq1:43-444(-)
MDDGLVLFAQCQGADRFVSSVLGLRAALPSDLDQSLDASLLTDCTLVQAALCQHGQGSCCICIIFSNILLYDLGQHPDDLPIKCIIVVAIVDQKREGDRSTPLGLVVAFVQDLDKGLNALFFTEHLCVMTVSR